MIQYKGLSLNYWVEAINYANYIWNITPTHFLKNITLEESCSKINTDVSCFLLFASVAWAHILMRKGNIYRIKVITIFLLVILKMSKVINIFKLILMKLLLEEMLNLMKID